MSSRAIGRHRAAVRPKTPLSTLASQLQAGAGTAGRRGAVIAASSGLVVSLGVTAADAAPIGGVEETPKAAQPSTAPAAPVVEAVVEPEQEQLTVPADVETVTVGAVAATVVAPPPPPPPPPPVVQATRASSTERASRSSARPAAATQDESEPSAAATGELSASRANVIAVAARYVGTPYRTGGTSPAGFDCSGFVQYVFAQVGISLPRTSGGQAGAATKISRSEAQPGDLVYKPGHVGIYAGGNQMYDSPTTGKSVSKRDIWSSEFGFYRVIGG